MKTLLKLIIGTYLLLIVGAIGIAIFQVWNFESVISQLFIALYLVLFIALCVMSIIMDRNNLNK